MIKLTIRAQYVAVGTVDDDGAFLLGHARGLEYVLHQLSQGVGREGYVLCH